VTTGLRRALNEAELKAVIAHEMGHIRARDVSKNMHLAAAVAGLGGVYEAGRILTRSKSSSKSKTKDKEGSTRLVGLGLMAGGFAAKLGGEAFRCAESRFAPASLSCHKRNEMTLCTSLIHD